MLGIRLGELAPPDGRGRLSREVLTLAGQAGRTNVLHAQMVQMVQMVKGRSFVLTVSNMLVGATL